MNLAAGDLAEGEDGDGGGDMPLQSEEERMRESALLEASIRDAVNGHDDAVEREEARAAGSRAIEGGPRYETVARQVSEMLRDVAPKPDAGAHVAKWGALPVCGAILLTGEEAVVGNTLLALSLLSKDPAVQEVLLHQGMLRPLAQAAKRQRLAPNSALYLATVPFNLQTRSITIYGHITLDSTPSC